MNTRLSELKQQIDRHNNLEDIKRNEQKYSTNVTFLTGYVKIVEYITKEAGFVPSQELKDKLRDALDLAKSFISSKGLNEKNVEILNKKKNECEAVLKQEWKKFYDDKSATVAGTIQYIIKIFPEDTVECQQYINAASVFMPDLSMFENYVSALSKLNQLIEGLKLDEKTKRFLLTLFLKI